MILHRQKYTTDFKTKKSNRWSYFLAKKSINPYQIDESDELQVKGCQENFFQKRDIRFSIDIASYAY